jgi:hypothetical protein
MSIKELSFLVTLAWKLASDGICCSVKELSRYADVMHDYYTYEQFETSRKFEWWKRGVRA